MFSCNAHHPLEPRRARTDCLSPRHEWRASEVTGDPELSYGIWAHHQPGRRRYRKPPGDTIESVRMRANPVIAASARTPPYQARVPAVTLKSPFPRACSVTRVLSAPATLEPFHTMPRGRTSRTLSGREASRAARAEPAAACARAAATSPRAT